MQRSKNISISVLWRTDMVMKSRLLLVSLSVLLCSVFWIDPVQAQEGGTTDNTSVSNKKTEVYIGIYVLGTLPQDKNLSVGGTEIQQTSVSGAVGAGGKAGVFPAFGRGYLGLEGELFGYGGKVNAPQTFTSGGLTQAQGNLTIVNAMVNLLARYPGELIQPYAGVGFGVSAASVTDATIQVGPMALTGESNDAAFAYQFFAGARAYITKKIFLFGEYKYFSANYKWEAEGGGPTTTLDFRTQIVSGGVGLSF